MQSKERKIEKLIRKIETLTYHFSEMEDYEKQNLGTILLAQYHEKMSNVSISLAECHVIDFIERNEMSNTTIIAKKLNITKGGISKITTKLIKKNMIESYHLTNNQKEIYFRLKPLGRKVFEVHEIMHKKGEEVFKKIFSVYSQNELEFADRFLADISSAIQNSININLRLKNGK